jgi:two-component system nitrogen regulation response regulator GlnG
MKAASLAPCIALLGEAPVTLRLRALVEQAAQVETPLFVEGERGSGREHIGRYIHSTSPRRSAAFIRIDAEYADTERAIGKLRRSHGGTLLVKDVPYGPLRLRKVLQGLLERQELESGQLRSEGEGAELPRLILTSDVELPRLRESGFALAELLLLHQVTRLRIPPLRERVSDVPLLAEHFLQLLGEQMGRRHKLCSRAVDQLIRYSWPGNLAELRDVISRSALRSRGETIELGEVEAVLPPLQERVPLEQLSLEETVRAKLRALLSRLEGCPLHDLNLYEEVLGHVERPLLKEVLQRTEGNQVRAAAILGINRNTLRKKLRERGLGSEFLDTPTDSPLRHLP